MDITITTAAIATIVSAITSAAINLYLAKENSRKRLDDQLDAILKIAVQYPYLESEYFTNSWISNHDKNNENFLRYEVYGTLVFNYLARFTAFYKYDIEKIEAELAVKDWVRMHAKYWRDPTRPYENVDTYEKAFVDLVENYLKGRME